MYSKITNNKLIESRVKFLIKLIEYGMVECYYYLVLFPFLNIFINNELSNQSNLTIFPSFYP